MGKSYPVSPASPTGRVAERGRRVPLDASKRAFAAGKTLGQTWSRGGTRVVERSLWFRFRDRLPLAACKLTGSSAT